ncbi:hypothetical protein LTR10_022714 [Elasticomyces elasticus]|uniref:PRISE-like Rossmann-fold domain-containing protein n=1 Tax=Exophiala sideris TaxID=1016849 RepID=A0ABR0IWA0_9EURO|nr:hypothetical protein LTR10_022714 [Elasticomyces elasticus]KAK5021498.1 hypothetical protein LTS07_011007 [Exophiala sideris]KAK5024479.1 hypothetical protein LTR13_010839 [Exophiala sideris]KAK5049630.1 hypothetical protein LTR69_011031 [Exophiala sideris]KAK5176575.1 hypothetical protein LTR44_010860 [Eurotiomycetes sp. CCFEE 6388]
MATTRKHALIFGASGVSGWAVVNQLLNDYPTAGTWSKVTALTNRPLDLETSQWPATNKLQIISGLNLLEKPQDAFEEEVKNKVTDIDTVTHVFYYAYKASTNFEQEKKDAVDMLSRSITAVDRLSPVLEFVAFQTGAKMYGFLLQEDHYFPVPLSESLPRLKPPFSDQLFYHDQLDWLGSYSAKKSWTWCETRPDIIIGFAPNHSAYSLAASLAIYFSLWEEINGAGSVVPFPGTPKSWRARHNEAGSDMIAKQTIFLSLHPSISGNGAAFNVASSPNHETWEEKWPQLCQYFGLRSAPPSEQSKEVRQYINDNLDQWRQNEETFHLRTDIAQSEVTMPGFEILHLTLADFDRHYDLSKIYNAGFQDKNTIMDTWGTTFDRMRKAKMIP